MITRIRLASVSAPRPSQILVAIVLSLWLSSCSEGGPGQASLLPVVDTLDTGAIHVRNSSVGLWDQSDGPQWRMKEWFRIGSADGDGPDVFGRIGAVVEDGAGQVWIADPMANEMRVFDGSGDYLRTVGRGGQGPGEFGQLASVHLGPDGKIWADDSRLRRWEVFDTQGVRVAGYPGLSNIGGGPRRWMADGRLLEGIRIYAIGMSPLDALNNARSAYIVREFDSQGGLIAGDTIPGIELPEPERVWFLDAAGQPSTGRLLPFAHNASAILGFNGDFWTTDGGGVYLIRRQTLEGDTLLIIERSYEPVPVSDRARERALEDLRPPEGTTSNDNDPARLAGVYPPFRSVHVATDGSIWVLRDLENDLMGLDVFAENGSYLGQVSVEGDLSNLSIRLITSDFLYAVETSELGVDTLVVFRVERT